MSGTESEKKRHPNWRKWLKRIFLSLLVLFLLLLALHRPILFYGVKYFAVKAAANAGMTLSYDIGGTIFSSLRITDLSIVPTKPGPVEKATVQRIVLEYSLLGLAKNGLAGLLKSVEVVGVDAEINPSEPKPKPEKKPGPLKIPPVFPERLRLEDINVVVHAKDKEDLVVKDFDFILDPQADGKFGIQRLNIPGVRDWRDIKAKSATYRDRNLVLTGLRVDDEVSFSKLNLDASKLDESKLGLAVDAALFEGTLALDAKVSDLNDSNALDVTGKIGGVSLAAIDAYLKLDKKLAGKVTNIGLQFEGLPKEPQTWTGANVVQLDGLALGGRTLLDKADLALDMGGGSASLNIRELRQASTVVTATAKMDLPKSADRFPWAKMTGQLVIDAPDLATLNLGDATKLEGAVTLKGPFSMDAGFFKADLTATARDVKSDAFGVETADLEIEVSRRLFDPDAKKEKSAENGSDGVGWNAWGVDVGPSAGLAVVGTPAPPTFPLRSQYIRVANGSPAPTASPTPDNGEPRTENGEPGTEKTGLGQLLQGFEFKVKGTATGIRAKDYEIDKVDIDVKGKDGKIDIETLDVKKGDNTVSLDGEVVVPEDAKTFDEARTDVGIDISAPKLKQFVAEQTGEKLEGALEVEGKVSRENGKLNGTLTANGSDLKFGGLAAEALKAEIAIADSVANISTLEVILDPKNRMNLTGTVELEKPFGYDAALDVKMPELSVLNPFLAKLEEKKAKEAKNGEDTEPTRTPPKKIAGSLVIGWKGSGKVEEMQHSGRIDLSASDVVFGEIVVSSAAIGGDYSPETIDIPTFTVNSNQGNVALKISLRDEQLKISDIAITREGGIDVTGEIGIPVDLTHIKEPAKLIPPEGEVAAALAVKELQLGPLLKKGEKPPALTGNVKANLTASGTVADLVLELKVEGRALQPTSLERLQPASLDLTARIADKRLTVNGAIKQPNINPLSLAGNMPLDLEQLMETKELDRTAPVKFDVKLARSDLSFLTQMSPEVRFVEGTVAINASVAGTIAEPKLSGAIDANIVAIRFAGASLPSLADLRVDVRFADDTVTVSRVGGDLSGGTFNLSGTVAVKDLANPTIDLRLVSDNALVMRNDTITVRVNSDVAMKGPLQGGAITGTVALTNSRFFREIEILPLELPGRPAPVPPSTGGTGFSLPPPLGNWTFDVAITTADSFLVRGNLANGGADADLKLVGTGAEPALVGTVQIVNFEASLPFSTLRITNGFVYFSKDIPFEPRLDIQGVSNLRDYRINMYIYGPASDTKTIFSSEPPLPQEDIISLLATGTTTEELTSGGDVAAGRAAALVVQKLWRTVFKKKNDPDAKTNPFLDRFEVDVGGVDPKTGEQDVSASFRASEHWQVIGDLDILGNVRGQLRYLIRFK